MRKILLFTLLALSIAGKSQSVTSVTMVPAAPTDEDPITFIVELTFPSGPCEGSAVGTVMGDKVYAAGSHCMGMLSVICTDYDTVTIAPQPAGDYSFIFVLSAGMGSPPCSPPFVPNDQDTTEFTVLPASTTGIKDFGNASKLEVFPNPASGYVNIAWKGTLTEPLKVNLIDETGRLVSTENLTGNNLTVKAEPGIYFVQVPSLGISRKLVMQ